MNHTMGLYDDPFEKIIARTKLIEIRLWDDKRRRLKVGDTITFTKLSNPSKQATVRVIAMDLFPTFRELYETLPPQILGANGESVDYLVQSTYDTYTPEQEKEFGAVAIHIDLLD